MAGRIVEKFRVQADLGRSRVVVCTESQPAEKVSVNSQYGPVSSPSSRGHTLRNSLMLNPARNATATAL